MGVVEVERGLFKGKANGINLGTNGLVGSWRSATHQYHLSLPPHPHMLTKDLVMTDEETCNSLANFQKFLDL